MIGGVRREVPILQFVIYCFLGTIKATFLSLAWGPIMNRCRIGWLNSLTILTLSLWVFRSPVSFGQDVLAANKRTVIDALRAVDSPLEKDMEWVVAFLEKRVEQNRVDSLANCVLAITQFRSKEFENAKQSFERSNSGDTAKETRATNGKFQLLCAINTDDKETATALFQNLLNACQRESTPFALRKSFCEWIGEVIGVLDSEEAQSPIEHEMLVKAKKLLIGIEETKLSQAFENQYSLSHAKAVEIRKKLLRYAEIGEAGMKDMKRTMSDELEKLEKILAASVKESRELSSENQASIKSLRLETVGIKDQMRRIEADWAKNGPGMPLPMFPPVSPPLLPNRDAVFVDPFYTRFVTENVNNQLVTRQIIARRDYRDIDAERNAVYQNQMNLYQSQMNNYNIQLSLFSQYQKNLADWKRREDERRTKLTEKRKTLEDQMVEIKAKIDTLEESRKDNAGGNTDLRNSITQLKAELESIRKVLNAAKTGKPHLALRPITIDPWLLTEEKNLLLKNFAGKH